MDMDKRIGTAKNKYTAFRNFYDSNTIRRVKDDG